jgi:ribose/xylose/arabinose/galactoside ABC-type transport system permease subunit
MGVFITYLKVQPFIATLAGMWLARGLCYVISDNEIRIYDPVWRLLSGTHILIPGLSDPKAKTGDYITIMVVVAVAILAFGMYLAHYTRFGRTVYAMGANNGAGEQSARLMGLPVNRTKVLVYVFSGFCAALGGIAYSVYAHSGHGTHATSMELTVIAAVVIGGTALTGGEGYLLGSLFGVLITELIQSLIRADGRISAWWTYILIGALMLFFIGVQSLLAAWNANALGRQRAAGSRSWVAAGPRTRQKWWQRKRTLAKIGVVGLIAAIVATGGYFVLSPKAAVSCNRVPLRQDQAEQLRVGGAVIVYERNGGNACVDELYAIYSDGRMTADDGKTIKEEQTTADKVSGLLTDIDNYRWFTQDFYSTNYDPCAACFTYYLTVTYKGQVKTVHAVDGDTAAPAAFWPITAKLAAIIPELAGSQPRN